MPTLGNSVQSTTDPWAVQQRIGTTDARLALNSMLMPVSGLSYIDYRSGVMASGSGNNTHLAMSVTSNSSPNNMTVWVLVGNCVINTAQQGAYMCALQNATQLTIATAHASLNRIDLIVARVYDDQNAAIGSAAGTRKFAVEVWQGDNVSGTATAPSITSIAAAGAIPLAEVRVNAGTTAITSSMITDRRGPGIVARGGMRGLYGSDSVPGASAYSEAGAYPGDQRWVHSSGFQHQVYYGSAMGWRGVHNNMTYNANPPGGSGIQWNKSFGATVPICSVNIPDPGTPYSIEPTARIEAWYGMGVRADYYVVLDSPSGPKVSWVSGDCRWNGGGDKHLIVNIAPIIWGRLTGAHSVHLVGVLWEQANNGYGWGLDRGKPLSTLLSVNVRPSTVQPDGTGGAVESSE